MSKQSKQEEILSALVAGTITQEQAADMLSNLSGGNTTRRVLGGARKTAKNTVWLSLGYKAEKGKSNSITLPRRGFESLIRLAKDGTLEGILKNWDQVELSESAKSAKAA